jgi:hypothetical protein
MRVSPLLEQAISDKELRVSPAEDSPTPRNSNGASASTTYGSSNGTNKSVHSGTYSNGTAAGVVASNGAVFPSGTSERNSSQNGASRLELSSILCVWQNLEFTVDFLAGGWVSSAMPKSTSLKYETR